MKIIKLIIAWTWIALPLGWGVYQSVQKSLPLFQESKADDTLSEGKVSATVRSTQPSAGKPKC